MNTGFIVLEHDLFQQSVEIATGYILPDALARTNPKLELQTVMSCLSQPLANAYIETNDNTTNPPPVTVNPSSSKCSTLSLHLRTRTHTPIGTSSSHPNATGATGNNTQNKSGALQSLPFEVTFGLLGLIVGFAVVF